MKLRSLPSATKVSLTLFSLVVIAGLVVSVLLVNSSLYHSPWWSPLSLESIRLKYSAPPLERALRTSMRQFVKTDQELETITSWLKNGGERSGFNMHVFPILQQRCLLCHGGGTTRGDVSLRNWGDISPLVLTRGLPRKQLLAQTHYHVFGIGGLILCAAILFSGTGLPLIVKNSIISLSFLALVLDISGWWLAKVTGHAALLILVAGSFMIFLPVLMLGIALVDMWKKAS